MSAQLPEITSPPNPPPWRDVRVLRWVGQILVVLVVAWGIATLVNNGITNLRASNLPTGFGFLSQDFRVAIPGLEGSAEYSIARAFGAGYLNTIRVILFGIPACTIIGIMIGIARLSENAMVRAAGTLYVETFRNVPVLLWIFFFYTVYLIESLPPIEEATTPLGIAVFSNRGIAVPWFNPGSSVSTFVGMVALGLLATVLVVAWRGKVNERTGQPSRGGLWGILTILVFVVVGHVVSGGALAFDTPSVFVRDNGIASIQDGINAQPAYVGLTVALTLYTASHVAEIVRGAIQAVPKGQSEAANAVALTTYQRYRFVVLPQAFRIMIPPLASQYLNLTKNSSLAVAIGFIEITSIFRTIVNNATPALQGIVVLMGLYLTFSLSISLVANLINRRLALETR